MDPRLNALVAVLWGEYVVELKVLDDADELIQLRREHQKPLAVSGTNWSFELSLVIVKQGLELLGDARLQLLFQRRKVCCKRLGVLVQQAMNLGFCDSCFFDAVLVAGCLGGNVERVVDAFEVVLKEHLHVVRLDDDGSNAQRF